MKKKKIDKENESFKREPKSVKVGIEVRGNWVEGR